MSTDKKTDAARGIDPVLRAGRDTWAAEGPIPQKRTVPDGSEIGRDAGDENDYGRRQHQEHFDHAMNKCD